MKYKKIILAVMLSAGVCSGTSALASGIPTVDAAAIAQMVQQLTQMQQMYSNMVQQYNTAVNTLQNFTGTRGLGLVDYNLNLRSLIPTSARSRLNGIMNGTTSLSSLGRDIFNRLKLGDACSNLDGEVKQNCLRAREFEAEQQAVLEEAANTANQRLQNIESLMSRINTATDAKSIADQIDINKAKPSSEIRPGKLAPYESNQTTHYSVVDKDGNAVAVTYTLNTTFVRVLSRARAVFCLITRWMISPPNRAYRTFTGWWAVMPTPSGRTNARCRRCRRPLW